MKKKTCPFCAEEIQLLAIKCRFCSEFLPDNPAIESSDNGHVTQDLQKKFPGLRVDGPLKDTLEEVEKQLILESLNKYGWNKSQVAKALGISRAGLITKVQKYRLEETDASEFKHVI